MSKFQKYNINLPEFEKDYGKGALKEYIKTVDNTDKEAYLSHKYTKFMKTIKGIDQYKMDVSRELGKYSMYLLAMIDLVKDDNSIDIWIFQKRNKISDNQINRMVATYKKANVLRKSWYIFYMNPLIAFLWLNIRPELWIIFEDELKKVWIDVKQKAKVL